MPDLRNLKYRAASFSTDARYWLSDLWSTPKGKRSVIASAVLGLLVIVMGGIYLPMLFGGGRRPEVRQVEETPEFKGSIEEWVQKANAALAGEPKFRNVTVSVGQDAEGQPVAVVSGTVPDWPERVALSTELRKLGKPKNLEENVTLGSAP